ncbi:AIR carboxylase family protein [Candidatus Woesearchaeota archaeon]|nr:AIR carboxylase family protein [Candidatus Woesearchaeota archaeon]
MKEILIIFGSKSDAGIYEPILNELANAELKICSAHRTPEFLDEILKTYYKLIISGAGLAAHLPGVIASKVTRPIIGVPCSGKFNGLDALLSIVQMPPGIPVLAVGVDNYNEAVRNAKLIFKKPDKVIIVENKEIDSEKIKKIQDLFSEFGVKNKLTKEFDENAVNLNFVNLNKISELIFDDDLLIVNVPVLDNSAAADSLKLMEVTKKGLWVGLNRYENAAIACIEIMNYDNRFTGKLKEKRDEMKRKIREMNI